MKILEHVALQFTDLTGENTGCTKLGSNKFWTGSVQDNEDGSFNFVCCWGSTGTAGSDKGSVRGTSRDNAEATLAKKVSEKTKKGYTRVETRTVAEEVAKAQKTPSDAPAAVVATVSAPAFHREVERLLGVIYGSTSQVVRSGLSAAAGATESNPIGNLSDRQLDVGGDILNRIQEILDRELGINSTATLPLNADGTPRSQIITLTNEYLSNIPRAIPVTDRGMQNLHRLVISNAERLEGQRKFLQLLRDAAVSADTFKAAAATTTVNDKVSVWYNGLNATVEFCEPGTVDFKRAKDIFDNGQSRKNSNWFRGGKSTLRVKSVFKFTRNGSDADFNQYAAKVGSKPGAVGRIMAWHGTRQACLLGISKSGLLLPENLPRGCKINGAAFGEGIYSAPSWSATGIKQVGGYNTDGTNGALKSFNYTSAQGAVYGAGNTSPNGFMFLQEVALGVPDVHASACWNQRRPNGWPNKDFIFACAAQNQGGFVHDEVVTFDQNAQVFRYLVEIEVQ